MSALDQLNGARQGEAMLQSLYNRYMIAISSPEVRQLFMQLRDAKMQNITQLEQSIKDLEDMSKPSNL